MTTCRSVSHAFLVPLPLLNPLGHRKAVLPLNKLTVVIVGPSKSNSLFSVRGWYCHGEMKYSVKTVLKIFYNELATTNGRTLVCMRL